MKKDRVKRGNENRHRLPDECACACVCVCVCVCVCARARARACAFVCAPMHICKCGSMSVCAQVHTSEIHHHTIVFSSLSSNPFVSTYHRERDLAQNFSKVTVPLYDMALPGRQVRADKAERRAVEQQSNGHTSLVASLAMHACLDRVHRNIPACENKIC